MISKMNAAAAAAPEEEEDWDAILEQQLHSLSDAASDTDEDVASLYAEHSVGDVHDLPQAASQAAELELKTAWSQLMASAQGVQQYWTSAEAVAAEVATLLVPPLRARIAANDEPDLQLDALIPAAAAEAVGSMQLLPAQPDQLTSAANEDARAEENVSEDVLQIEHVLEGDTDVTATSSNSYAVTHSPSPSRAVCDSAALEVEASTVLLQTESEKLSVPHDDATADDNVYQGTAATAGADDIVSYQSTTHTEAAADSTVKAIAVVPTALPMLPVPAPLAAVAAADDEAVVLDRLQRASEVAAAERKQRRDSLRAQVSQTTACFILLLTFYAQHCSCLRSLLHC